MKKILKNSLIILLVFAILTFAIIWIKGFDLKINYIDAFQVMGLTCIFVGLLVLLADLGTFRFAGYSMYYAKNVGIKKEDRKYKDYTDYKEQKAEECRNKCNSCISYFVAGAILLLISLVFY